MKSHWNFVFLMGLLASASAQAQSPQPQPAAAPKESLYSEATYMSLTSDRRVRRVGDIVSVVIYENSSASSTADTAANRDADVGVSVNIPRFNHSGVANTTNDFSGGGRTQRAGKVLAQLTVTVVDIAPNQDLLVAGEQLLEINGERQTIRLEGRVRPRDITEQNTVLSTRVADAKISFAGEGVVGDRQRPGWWQQLLTLFGL
jgi:flagellar L-ring protein precursor FlgH